MTISVGIVSRIRIQRESKKKKIKPSIPISSDYVYHGGPTVSSSCVIWFFFHVLELATVEELKIPFFFEFFIALLEL